MKNSNGSEKIFDQANDVSIEVLVDTHNPIVVEVSEWKGEQYLDVREWYFRKNDGRYARTRSAVRVEVDDALVLIQAQIDAYNSCVPEEAQVDLAFMSGEPL